MISRPGEVRANYEGIVPINRGLISVYYKDFLPALFETLQPTARHIELLSTGGSAKEIIKLGYNVRDVADYTQFPESPDDLVKTLHPRVHGGLLMDPAILKHREYMQAQGIDAIDLFVGNLYPFAEEIKNPKATFQSIRKKIDIGGPTMLRAAAKSFPTTATIIDPEDVKLIKEYDTPEGKVIGTNMADRFRLAQKAFAYSQQYEAAIATYLNAQDPEKVAKFFLEMNHKDYDKDGRYIGVGVN